VFLYVTKLKLKREKWKASQKQFLVGLTPVTDPIILLFFAKGEFFLFLLLSKVVLLSIIFLLHVTNTQTKQQKLENEEKKLNRIGSWLLISEVCLYVLK